MEERLLQRLSGASAMRELLSREGFAFEWFDHPPAHTCDDIKSFGLATDAIGVKNLFVYEPKSERYFLVLVDHDTRVDLKRLGKLIGARLSFASPERLEKVLGIQPGSVTPLALINDGELRAELIIDEDLWRGNSFQLHPLENTATVTLSRDDLERFFSLTKHVPRFVSLQAENELSPAA